MGRLGRQFANKCGSEKYKYVREVVIKSTNKSCWVGTVLKRTKICDTEIEAAKFVDLTLIKAGKNPVNVFKKVD